MKPIILPLGAVLTLAGCAHTTKGYREQTPRLELSSEKSPPTVLGCITEIWQSEGRATQYTPLANGGTISVALPTMLISTGNLQLLVDAEVVDGKTRVRFFGMKTMWAKMNRADEDRIKQCM